ncbi:FHA domain-containing protein [Microbacterium esteraromaticum]|uniref:FHA domain-containing protein n=1 Tax=Microbacterium esteraromaticum TaxID=57043 RepID=A0A7D8AAW5_9MICO|nr:RDD family protein [Microbacterium esteraromaticum]QMU97081.1 FHA domain-containing protein [Microbacterium esteraromaticum]
MIWEIDDGERQIEGLDAAGRPDPAYAASLGLLPAPFGRRSMATLVELLILLAIAAPAMVVATPALLSIVTGAADPAAMLEKGDLLWPIVTLAAGNVLAMIFVILQLVLLGRKGVTAGKAMFGLRTVNVRTLEQPRFWRGAVVRYLLICLSFLLPLLGPLLVVALSPFFDAERRGRSWLDQAAATWMVDVRRGLNPYDAKRMRIARKSVRIPEHERGPALPSLATPVDRDAPAAYTPSGRFSGGVIGAHRGTSAPRTDGPAAPAAPAPAAPFAPAVASSGMVDAVPPPLASGQLLDSFASRPAAPAPAPAPAPAAPAPAPAAPAPAAPAPAAAPAPSLPPSAASAAVVSSTAGQPAHAPSPGEPAAGVRAVLQLDDGSRIEVRGATLIGRAPAPVAGEGAVQLVAIADDTRSVSKTHLAILPARRGVLVVDRGSTNGSAIVRAGSEMPVTPGDPAPVQVGDVVRFGDRTLTVERA